MAKATRQPTPVILELSESEAEFLLRLLGNHIVGGGRYRLTADEIFYALNSLFEREDLESLPVDAALDRIYLVNK